MATNNIKRTAHTIFKRLKACRFDRSVLLNRFELSEYEKDCFNKIYGSRLGTI